MTKLPLFKSHYSVGRSILTLKEEQKDPREPDSIFQICKESGLDHFFLVDDSISGYMEAYQNSKKAEVDFSFGLRLRFCPNLEDKSEESLRKTAKYVVLARNNAGYKRLIKIWNRAAVDGFYYHPRADFKLLKENWSSDDLILAIPFYDSFIFQNTLTLNACSDDFLQIPGCKPVFFQESNDLPFDALIDNRMTEYANRGGFEIAEAQSIYYRKKVDFQAYLTYRCINNRTRTEKPNLDHFSSDQFYFEKLL